MKLSLPAGRDITLKSWTNNYTINLNTCLQMALRYIAQGQQFVWGIKGISEHTREQGV